MNRFFPAALLGGLLCALPARACDICGGGVSNYNPYLFPQLSKSYIGLGYTHRSFRTKGENGSWSRERYQTLLLTGQYRLGRRLQLLGLLPWQHNALEQGEARRQVAGLGDLSLLAQYRLLDRPNDKGIRHTFLAGGGLKLATGRFVPAGSGKAEDQNLQLGSGSTDFLLNASYRLSVRKWLFVLTGSYKYNTVNSDGFRFGDIGTGGVMVAYRKEWKKFSVAPYVQAGHEFQYQDAERQVLQAHSGGSFWYTGGGFDINTRAITVGINCQWAPLQELAGGAIKVLPRAGVQASFSF
ncbi:hypothetical protein [Flaviaesturariibacter amylovorans]|uniref:Transporter n=1 Tax=Flaviaesturariibacter amylovorans TaxID=1084520 RepID=A0ABP8H5I2_9BACT